MLTYPQHKSLVNPNFWGTPRLFCESGGATTNQIACRYQN